MVQTSTLVPVELSAAIGIDIHLRPSSAGLVAAPDHPLAGQGLLIDALLDQVFLARLGRAFCCIFRRAIDA